MGLPGAVSKKLFAPVDIEGHLGTDGRYYVVVRTLLIGNQLAPATEFMTVGLCSHVPARTTVSSKVRARLVVISLLLTNLSVTSAQSISTRHRVVQPPPAGAG